MGIAILKLIVSIIGLSKWVHMLILGAKKGCCTNESKTCRDGRQSHEVNEICQCRGKDWGIHNVFFRIFLFSCQSWIDVVLYTTTWLFKKMFKEKSPLTMIRQSFKI